MKKKIGFVDLFIDEWHANNYPAWIKAAPRADEFELAYAWQAEQREGLKTLEEWCAEFGAAPCASLEELVEKSDAIFVLAPSNPEVHEMLAELPLKSGKCVYIDKPFAPDKAAAERMFALADRYGTKMFSSSALRFGSEIAAVRKAVDPAAVDVMTTTGGGRSFEEYAIHQAEMIVSVMGTGIDAVMQCGSGKTQHCVVRYKDGRRAAMTLNPSSPFTVAVYTPEKTETITTMGDFFPNLLASILDFFADGNLPVDRKETIEIAALLRTAIDAQKTPDQWVKL
ncbi:MAG: Gfo/Idh/MocA family oxidoreductase [Lentisphaeria bacterium]|nr:Gfo/Idh/MocA family oxidoreductase [Lentisphaeria bacterium]